MQPIRVALAGTGNCAYSFVQFVLQAKAQPGEPLAGLMCPSIGGYALGDIDVVAAFDIDKQKVDVDLAEAFEADTVNASRVVEVPAGMAHVLPGPLLDGIDGPLRELVVPHEAVHRVTVETVTQALVRDRVDVLLVLLPTGSHSAVRAYATAAAAAGVACVNATPEMVARDPEMSALFLAQRATLLGDDLRSHLGATTLHTSLIELITGRGLSISDTYQLNIGGNTDFLNLADPGRASTKFASKKTALRASGLDVSVSAGPSGHVASLGDNKVCYINLRAESVLGTTVQVDVKLTVEDSPNAAGALANAARAAKAASDRGRYGAILEDCSMLFKSAPVGLPESRALERFRAFAAEPARTAEAGRTEATPQP